MADMVGLTWEERLEYRRHGLLPADLPVLMEASEYKSVLALFEEKSERKPLELLRHEAKARKKQSKGKVRYRNVFYKDQFCQPVIDPDADFSLSAGIRGADKLSIARHLSISLGFPVYREHILYRHPEYPFLLASPEFIMVATNPVTGEMKTILLELHTTTYWKREEWEAGVPHPYELRCRQAMCVMNVDEAIIACLYDNNEGGIATYRIARDYGVEADIIQSAKAFWCGHVEKNIFPTPTIPTKAAKREIAEYARQQEKWKPLPQLFEVGLAELVRAYDAAKAELDAQKQRYDEARKALDAIELQLSTHMYHHDEAICGGLKLRWTQRKTRSVDYEAFKLAHPLLYGRFVQEKVSLGFEVKAMKRKETDTEKEAA